MKNVMHGIYVVFLAACTLACHSKIATEKPLPKYVQNLDSLMRIAHERALFNGTILVSKKDTVVYQRSFGYTDVSQRTALDLQAIFNIGSIAKEFNGVAVMVLVERGQLSLDDPLSKFELGLPDWDEQITIKHLLNYSDGLPKIPISVRNDQQAFQYLRNLDTLLFEPGTDFNYTNFSVFLQRRIIEKVSGQSFQEFVMETFVKPLKMTSAVFDPKPDHPRRTSCYDLEGKECAELEFISGWLWMDIEDLHRWIRAMNADQVISEASFELLLRNPFAKDMTSSIGEYFEEHRLQRHNGTSLRFESLFLNDFENETIIILLSNNLNRVLQLGHLAHDIVMGVPFEIPKRSIGHTIKKTCLDNIDEGIATYNKLKEEHPEEYNFEDPSELNRLGYALFRTDQTAEAIQLFLFAISEFPKNANLHDSLGEVYLNSGQEALALEYYEKAIALGGTRGNAKKMIEKIKGQ